MVDENQDETTPQGLNLVEQAKAQADRIEAGLKEFKELVERNEKTTAQQMLGGRSEAGQPAPEKKEETPQEYAAKVMAGEVGDGAIEKKE